MSRNKRRFSLSGAIAALIGLACALVLGGVFYVAMAYQLAGSGEKAAAPLALALTTPVPLAQDLSAGQLFPGALMAIEGMTPVSERAQDVQAGGKLCRVITREYALEDGMRAEAVSAYPAAYLERMAQEKYVPQLITGFMLAGMDAVYAVSGGSCALYARDGECAYVLFAPADEETAYALGAAAYLEE